MSAFRQPDLTFEFPQWVRGLNRSAVGALRIKCSG
jgi:hypothetical protein